MRDSLYKKLFNKLEKEQNNDCCSRGYYYYSDSTDYYDDSEYTDQQFTFGSHKMRGGFIAYTKGNCEKVSIISKFSIRDIYDWRKQGQQTKLPIPYLGVYGNPVFGTVFILTTWADELVDANPPKAQEFKIYLDWKEKIEWIR